MSIEIEDILTAQEIDNDRRQKRYLRLLSAVAKMSGSIERKIYADRIDKVFNLPCKDSLKLIDIERKNLLTKASPTCKELGIEAFDIRKLADELKKRGI